MTEIGDVREVIERAFDEDFGERGDVTSMAVITADATSTARIMARASGCIAGIGIAEACFLHVDPTLTFTALVHDGDTVPAGTPIAEVAGSTRSILGAERVALNLLGRLSGIATATRRFVDAVAGTSAVISDTRKTTPGLRSLEKHAVVAGGGRNHRFGLYDAVLIKDNHIAAAGTITRAVTAARALVGTGTSVEVEVDTLTQLDELLRTDADAVLLDNMGLADLRTAITMVNGRLRTEASGGVTIDTVRAIADTGVDVISVGWITHSAPALDVALDLTAGSGAVTQFENV